MGTRFLIDTCSVIKYLTNAYSSTALSYLDNIVNIKSNISFITQIELLVWDQLTPSEIYIIEQFIKRSNVYSPDSKIIETTIDLRKKNKIKLPDSIIAATCISKGLSLITDNISDFKKVSGITLVNPYDY